MLETGNGAEHGITSNDIIAEHGIKIFLVILVAKRDTEKDLVILSFL